MSNSNTVWRVTDHSSRTNRSLTVNDVPFFSRGVAYSPVPWGGDPNWTPFGDYLFNTWSEVYDRDLPLMRAKGINVIRTYNIENVNPNSGAAQDHSDFFNKCWNGGVDPIYVLVGFGPLNNTAMYYPWESGSDARDSAKTAFLSMVDKYKDFPAVMGFVIANEVNSINSINNPKFWSWMNDLSLATKTAAPDKITVMSLVDDSMDSVKQGNALVPNLDIWGINSYRGNVNQANNNNFTNIWSSFADASEKPLLITEWGAPASTHDTNGNLKFSTEVMTELCSYIDGHLSDIVFNNCEAESALPSNPNSANWSPVCVGSCYFEWTDEWWKMDSAHSTESCSATKQDPGVTQNNGFPGGWDDEECFGLNSIQPTGTDPVPSDRPGPSPSNNCPGPWDFSKNKPYPADALTPRESLTELFKNNFTVDSKKSWQSTGVQITTSSTVTVVYLSGSWTADPNVSEGALFTGKGNPAFKAKSLYPMEGQNTGALVGRVGDNGTPFLIGNGPVVVPNAVSGELQLVINDDLDHVYGAGLADNVGSIVVAIRD